MATPAPPLSGNELAAWVGVNRTTIQNWQAAGMPRRDDGKFNLPEVIRWLRDRSVAESSPSGTLEEERTRLAKEQADQTALKNAQLRGELIDADAVEAAWCGMVGAFRSRMLGIPTKAAPHVVSANSINEVRGILEGMIYEALDELRGSGVPQQVAPDTGEGDVAGEASSAPVRKRVGRPPSKVKSRK